jgi:hypothetical protein
MHPVDSSERPASFRTRLHRQSNSKQLVTLVGSLIRGAVKMGSAGWFSNPFYLLVIPFILLLLIPISICAGITTMIASFILILRLFLVYCDFGLELVRLVLGGRDQPEHYVESPSMSRRPSGPTTPTESPTNSPLTLFPKSHKGRRSSATIGYSGSYPHDRLGWSSTKSLTRDYEGLGGWRLRDSRNSADEHAWESLNSRLEIPDSHRHHFRSQTCVVSPGSERVRPSARHGSRSGPHSPERHALTPSSPRSRTPTRTKIEPFTNISREDSTSYFPFMSSPASRKVAV